MSIFDGGWDESYWFLHNCLFISALITFCQVCAGKSLQHVSLILVMTWEIIQPDQGRIL